MAVTLIMVRNVITWAIFFCISDRVIAVIDPVQQATQAWSIQEDVVNSESCIQRKRLALVYCIYTRITLSKQLRRWRVL